MPLSHIDFDPNQTNLAVIEPFFDTWSEKLSDELGSKIQNINYWSSKKKIVKMVNVWISLTENGIKEDPLALMDKRTVDKDQVINYWASRRRKEGHRENFIARAMKYNSKNKWYWKSNMKFGEAFIFDSFYAPHTAFKTGEGSSRQSIELRLMFIDEYDDVKSKALTSSTSTTDLPTGVQTYTELPTRSTSRRTSANARHISSHSTSTAAQVQRTTSRHGSLSNPSRTRVVGGNNKDDNNNNKNNNKNNKNK